MAKTYGLSGLPVCSLYQLLPLAQRSHLKEWVVHLLSLLLLAAGQVGLSRLAAF
jgi:hypothetical protein